MTIYGCGALGSRLAVQFHEVGMPVRCLSRPGIHVERIRSRGLVYGGSGQKTRTVCLEIHDDPSSCPPADLVIVLVKSWQNPEVAANLKGLLSPDGWVLTLQNGLGNVEALQEHVPEGKLLAGSISYGAFRPEPGVVYCGGDGFIRFAPVTPGVDAKDVLGLFRAAGFNADLEDEPWRAIWAKVIVNAGVNPVAALTRSSNAQILGSPFARKVMESLCREAVSVADAEGIPFDPDEQWSALLEILELTSGNRPSMLQDILSGNRTEIEAISGEIMRRGIRAGLEVPVTETVCYLVKALEVSVSR
ncbi:MAG: 2-dehydropantoate 2-reductase, partial [Synergistaceae bacterium]|nr:2-dehydropantoate 2-reductase [Synergistaceae bacterium]